MEDFICTKCWKEFTLPEDESRSASQVVVCPGCGSVMELAVVEPAGLKTDPDAEPSLPETHEAPNTDENPGTTVSDDDDEEIGFEDPMAEESTSPETLPTRKVLAEDLASNFDTPTEWCLRTSSGLTFRFTDPDALLGWKKKTQIYKEMMVSPDGRNWVDFMDFIGNYEAHKDPKMAFLSAFEATKPEMMAGAEPEPNPIVQAVRTGEFRRPSVTPPTAAAKTQGPTKDFQFKTVSDTHKSSVWPTVFGILTILGLAGAAAFALYYFGII
jgi:DNA-directed RNA polymerase subunit RPC12/RpoP